MRTICVLYNNKDTDTQTARRAFYYRMVSELAFWLSNLQTSCTGSDSCGSVATTMNNEYVTRNIDHPLLVRLCKGDYHTRMLDSKLSFI
jgi:hypothetical protein